MLVERYDKMLDSALGRVGRAPPPTAKSSLPRGSILRSRLLRSAAKICCFCFRVVRLLQQSHVSAVAQLRALTRRKPLG